MISRFCGALLKDQIIYFLKFGANELGAFTTIGPVERGPTVLESVEAIGLAVKKNLTKPKLLTPAENKDTQNFERACVAAGFKNSNDLFKGGQLVQIYEKNEQTYLIPTKSIGRRSIGHEFKQQILSGSEPANLGENLLRAFEQSS